MDYDMETKAATEKPSPALIELQRLGEVTESLDNRVEMLARRLEMVLEPDSPEVSPSGNPPDMPRPAAPLVNEMRHLAVRLHRIEGRLADLYGRIQV